MSTQITQVKWNTEKPKFEDVEGKTLVVRNDNFDHLKFFYSFDNIDYSVCTVGKFVAYAVLSDEQAVCEYKKVTLGDPEETFFMPQCEGGYLPLHFDQFSFCPHCGLPIHIVDELKPLPLMGIEPRFEHILVSPEYTASRLFVEHKDFYFRCEYRDTDREAIESWNSLVKKLTGEK